MVVVRHWQPRQPERVALEYSANVGLIDLRTFLGEHLAVADDGTPSLVMQPGLSLPLIKGDTVILRETPPGGSPYFYAMSTADFLGGNEFTD